MTKVKAPLFSLAARGALGDDLFFTTADGHTVARRQQKHANPKTPTQVAHRSIFQGGIQYWHTLTPAEKQAYHVLNPQIGANPAYLNFMRSWLMGTVPSHATEHEDGGSDPISNPLALAAIPRSRTHNDTDYAEELTQQGVAGALKLSALAVPATAAVLELDGQVGAYDLIRFKGGGDIHGSIQASGNDLVIKSVAPGRDLALSAASGYRIDIQKAIYNGTSNNSGRVQISDHLQYTGYLYPGNTADATTPGNVIKKFAINIGGVEYYVPAYDAIT